MRCRSVGLVVGGLLRALGSLGLLAMVTVFFTKPEDEVEFSDGGRDGLVLLLDASPDFGELTLSPRALEAVLADIRGIRQRKGARSLIL